MRRRARPLLAGVAATRLTGIAAAGVGIALLAACSSDSDGARRQPVAHEIGPAERVDVRFVADGDTVQLTDGRWVRLVQIDSPETGEGDEECYGTRAREALEAQLADADEIIVVADPALDDRDRFGRLLRYVYVDGGNVNRALVQEGAATVWFFRGDMGAVADSLLAAAREARARGLGLWGACPGTPFDTDRGADTGAPG